MFTQQALIFIWVTGVLVKSYADRSKKTTFRMDAKAFIQKLFQHPAVIERKCRIVFVTAKPKDRIIPVIKSLTGNVIKDNITVVSNIVTCGDITILAREDIIVDDRVDATSPVEWIRVFNSRHGTKFTTQNTWIIDCNYITDSGKYMPYGKMAGPKFATHTLLLKPLIDARAHHRWTRVERDVTTAWHADNLLALADMLICYFNTIYSYSELPLSVFTSLKNVLEESI